VGSAGQGQLHCALDTQIPPRWGFRPAGKGLRECFFWQEYCSIPRRAFAYYRQNYHPVWNVLAFWTFSYLPWSHCFPTILPSPFSQLCLLFLGPSCLQDVHPVSGFSPSLPCSPPPVCFQEHGAFLTCLHLLSVLSEGSSEPNVESSVLRWSWGNTPHPWL
jgi:hypothetical protein